jgi:pimeloyl-ACP methyl ester carboxylesterase
VRSRALVAAVLFTAGLVGRLAAGASPTDPAIVTVYPVADAGGLMVTSGGWAYCEQVRSLARRTRYTLLCGRYYKDEYVGRGLRSRRHLDWGDAAYLAQLAAKIRALHRSLGGKLVLIGVSYSGFGVAVLASHHPELAPDRLIVIDSYLDLPARRRKLPASHETAREIDDETSGSEAALRRRSVSIDGLARLVQQGTRLTVVWSVSEDERRFFRGATCDLDASAQTPSRLARLLRHPLPAWVIESRHGQDLWRFGTRIIGGYNPGRKILLTPDGSIPSGAVCA